MATVADLRRVSVALGVMAVLGACVADAPASAVVSSSPASASAAPSVAPSAPTSPEPMSPAPSEPAGLALPDPGRPFDATTLLDAMRTSRRPGGVPDQLETDQIAGAAADAIVTIDAQPWTTMAIGGSCGPERCTLEVAGTRPGSLGEDLWVLEVVPETGSVTVSSATLAAIPDELVTPLDELARSLVEPDRLDDLVLASIRWLPAAADGRFVLVYRSGGEEGSCAADVTLDALTPAVIGEAPPAC